MEQRFGKRLVMRSQHTFMLVFLLFVSGFPDLDPLLSDESSEYYCTLVRTTDRRRMLRALEAVGNLGFGAANISDSR